MANTNDRNDPGTTNRTGTGMSGSGNLGDWNSEENYWRSNWRSRPYATADQSFDTYSPGYRYGYDAANRYRGRNWNDVETDLRSGWDTYEHRGNSRGTWDNIKHAVKDAWDRVTGSDHMDAANRRNDDISRRSGGL